MRNLLNHPSVKMDDDIFSINEIEKQFGNQTINILHQKIDVSGWNLSHENSSYFKKSNIKDYIAYHKALDNILHSPALSCIIKLSESQQDFALRLMSEDDDLKRNISKTVKRTSFVDNITNDFMARSDFNYSVELETTTSGNCLPKKISNRQLDSQDNNLQVSNIYDTKTASELIKKILSLSKTKRVNKFTKRKRGHSGLEINNSEKNNYFNDSIVFWKGMPKSKYISLNQDILNSNQIKQCQVPLSAFSPPIVSKNDCPSSPEISEMSHIESNVASNDSNEFLNENLDCKANSFDCPVTEVIATSNDNSTSQMTKGKVKYRELFALLPESYRFIGNPDYCNREVRKSQNVKNISSLKAKSFLKKSKNDVQSNGFNYHRQLVDKLSNCDILNNLFNSSGSFNCSHTNFVCKDCLNHDFQYLNHKLVKSTKFDFGRVLASSYIEVPRNLSDGLSSMPTEVCAICNSEAMRKDIDIPYISDQTEIIVMRLWIFDDTGVDYSLTSSNNSSDDESDDIERVRNTSDGSDRLSNLEGSRCFGLEIRFLDTISLYSPLNLNVDFIDEVNEECIHLNNINFQKALEKIRNEYIDSDRFQDEVVYLLQNHLLPKRVLEKQDKYIKNNRKDDSLKFVYISISHYENLENVQTEKLSESRDSNDVLTNSSIDQCRYNNALSSKSMINNSQVCATSPSMLLNETYQGWVKFCCNVDIRTWTSHIDALERHIPSWLHFRSESNILNRLRLDVEGVNSPQVSHLFWLSIIDFSLLHKFQVYIKVPGVWTGGHEENLRYTFVV